MRGGVGYNNEILDRDGRKTGLEGLIEVGVNVPIFNRNQGGIAAAEAELAIAERELDRLDGHGRRPAHDFLRHALPYVPSAHPISRAALTRPPRFPRAVYTFLGES